MKSQDYRNLNNLDRWLESAEFITRAESRARYALFLGGVLTLLLASLFLALPEIDIAFSRLFFSQSPAGSIGEFWLSNSPVLKFFFWFVDAVSRIVLLFVVVITVYYAIKKHPRFLASSILSVGLVLGPVVVVNGVFKDHWDRARPRQVVEFGGSQKFTPAWVVSDQCIRNCSFTSGHAAAGFSFVVAHFVAASRIWIWIGIIFGAITGLTRIMVGAHFLSDVIFSFFIVYLISALVAYLFSRIARKLSSQKT